MLAAKVALTAQREECRNEVRGSARLSPAEKEVLLQVVEGRPNKVIARHLSTTEATVKVHLKNLLRKIRVENRTQATIWALANLPEVAARALRLNLIR